MTYISQIGEAHPTSLEPDLLRYVYITDILMVGPGLRQDFEAMLDYILDRYHDLLKLWMMLDENSEYFEL